MLLPQHCTQQVSTKRSPQAESLRRHPGYCSCALVFFPLASVRMSSRTMNNATNATPPPPPVLHHGEWAAGDDSDVLQTKLTAAALSALHSPPSVAGAEHSLLSPPPDVGVGVGARPAASSSSCGAAPATTAPPETADHLQYFDIDSVSSNSPNELELQMDGEAGTCEDNAALAWCRQHRLGIEGDQPPSDGAATGPTLSPIIVPLETGSNINAPSSSTLTTTTTSGDIPQDTSSNPFQLPVFTQQLAFVDLHGQRCTIQRESAATHSSSGGGGSPSKNRSVRSDRAHFHSVPQVPQTSSPQVSPQVSPQGSTVTIAAAFRSIYNCTVSENLSSSTYDGHPLCEGSNVKDDDNDVSLLSASREDDCAETVVGENPTTINAQ